MATLAQWKTQMKADNPKPVRHTDGTEFTDEEYDAAIDVWAKNAYDHEQDMATNGYKIYRVHGKGDSEVEVYPDLTEQLDKLWHDIDQGKLDKTGDFYTAIKKVKEDSPK
jgi:hypothetical protein